MRIDNFDLYVVALFLVVSAAALTALGWVMNIVDLFSMFGGAVTPMLLARIVGIPFAPLGAILGWFY